MNIGTIASRNAWRYPNKVGLVDANNGQRMTWAEFNSAVNRLAHALLARGLKKGDAIAIYSRNSLEYMQLFMAGAKTGIVIQPMNWRFNADEIAYTLKDGARAASWSPPSTPPSSAQFSINSLPSNLSPASAPATPSTSTSTLGSRPAPPTNLTPLPTSATATSTSSVTPEARPASPKVS